ncbi:MAG TPA: hypothetical protein VNX68_08565 [Nitrosopumilaceae archaeon]|jgi:hypothetical protein|nr:hypothetical protein [Nitrosopumilaceae archaeon]
MKWATLLLIISISACKNKNPVCLIDASDIMKGSIVKLISVKDSNYKIVALYDPGWDSLKGGAYLFYPNQFLKSYTFYQNRIPVYTENYDERGYLIHTMGSPMVDRVINELGEDSVYVQVYFYKPRKSYQQLNIKINNGAAVNYTLETDTVYSNMKSVTFGINTSDLTHINMYSQIKYLDDCSKAEHILSDSLFLLKDPHNGLTPAKSK